jgi:AcrR family transcriptional regulator
VTAAAKTRLPAAERRRAIVDAALLVFSEGSYAGATTAGIAREAGVSEPILYRHFPSKRDLYFACLDEAWAQLRERIEARIGELGTEPEQGLRFVAPAALRQLKFRLPSLWMQAITEAGEDPEIRRHVRRHMQEVHGFFAGFVRRMQELGAVRSDRDSEAEAWILVAGILLVSLADRLGGLLSEEDFAAILAQRHRWLAGTD